MIGEYPCCSHCEFPDEIVHNYPCPLCQWRTPKTEDEREGCPVETTTEKTRDDDIGLAVRVGDEWVPVAATPTTFEWADADEAEPRAEEWSLGEQSWRMTVELAESEPVISMIRRLEREERQRRMLARWWLRFPYPVRARCSRGWLV